jgi:glucokinase
VTLTPTSLRTTLTAGMTGLLNDFAAAWTAINQLTNGAGIEITDVVGSYPRWPSARCSPTQ